MIYGILYYTNQYWEYQTCKIKLKNISHKCLFVWNCRLLWNNGITVSLHTKVYSITAHNVEFFQALLQCAKPNLFEPQHDNTSKITQRRLRSAWATAQSDQEYSQGAPWVAKDPMFFHVDSEDRSDWVDAQADLSLHWAHMSFCWFCHVVAQFHFHWIIMMFLRGL